MQDTGAVKLIRPGRRVALPDYEQIVLLDRNDGLLRHLPIGGVKYVAPKGPLPHAVSFDGGLLPVTIRDTRERIVLYPRFRVTGLARDIPSYEAGRLLAAALHAHLDRQIPRLRQLIDEIFADHVRLQLDARSIDAIANTSSAGAEEILRPVRAKLGLEIDWVLDPEPRIAAWVQKLQALIAETMTQSFNHESQTAQFNLTYSARILSVVPSQLHVVQRRVESNAKPEDELRLISKRVFAILNPHFGAFGGESQVWCLDNFWKLVELAFDQVITPTIAEEFGYQALFRNFRRERTPAELAVLKTFEDPARLRRDFDHAEQLYLEVKERERSTIAQNDYDMNAEFVQKIQESVRQARARMDAAQAEMEQASRGRATTLSPENSARALKMLKAFHDQLRLGHPELLQIGTESNDAGVDA